MAKRVLRAWKVQKPVAVIPSGVELHHVNDRRAELRKKYHLPAGAKVLLYAGRLSKEKNIPFLLKAFSKLEEKDVYLALVGGGPLLKEIRNSKFEIRNLVCTGEVPYPEILSYYSMGDIFVFSSTTETQGLVLAEAKAAGLPVVALFAGGLAGTVRSGLDGYLVPRKLESFVEHIKRLLTDDNLREKMSRAAREDARERFSSVAVAKQIETVYNSLIKRGD